MIFVNHLAIFLEFGVQHIFNEPIAIAQTVGRLPASVGFTLGSGYNFLCFQKVGGSAFFRKGFIVHSNYDVGIIGQNRSEIVEMNEDQELEQEIENAKDLMQSCIESVEQIILLGGEQ